MGEIPEKTAVAQALATLQFLHPPGGVFEICLIGPKAATSPHWEGRAGGKKPIVAGWFRNPEEAAALASQVSAEGIYTTLNPCVPSLLARANGRLKANVDRTQDKEISHLRNLLIDLDPIRPAGISSSREEHESALQMAQEIREDRAGAGWPEPLFADSGNGGHLVYPLELENTPEQVELLKRVLQALAWRYDVRLKELNLDLDQKVFNPARLSKIYGTVAGKGDNLPERPHRRAQILSLPAEREPVAPELLEKLAEAAPPSTKRSPGQTPGPTRRPAPTGKGHMDVAAYLAAYGKEVVKVKDVGGSTLYCLEECVFDETHRGNEAAIGQTAEGALFYQCFHNSCKGRLWVEARRLISGDDKLRRFFPGGGVQAGKPAPTGKPAAAGSAPSGPPGALPENPGLPQIIITHRFLQDKSGEGLAALEQANDPPVIFVRAGALARVLRDEKNTPCIDTLSDLALRGLLCRRALFYKQTTQGLVPASPPMEIPRDIMALGGWSFPSLEGVTGIPIFRPDGSVCSTPGYDPATRLYYVGDPDLEDFPEIPENPTPQEVETARYVLLDIFSDMPFADQADKANALALLLTLPLRPAIAGLVPMAVITAPTPGTGKSLLADVVSIVGTGKVIPMEGLSNSDDETRKLITSLLDKSVPVICFDNVEGDLRAPSLARALTCMVWEDRILGKSATVSLPQRALWLATGNNVRLRGDLPRRTFPIRLDAKMSKPWERKTFKHPQLRDFVRQWWRDYLQWAFVLGQAWIQAGKPPPAQDLPVLGGYEGWVQTMGGILAFAGIEGFLTNLDDFHAAADQEGQEWEAFLENWRERIGDNAVSCAEITEVLRESSEFAATLPGYLSDVLKNSERSFERSLGKALAQKEKRPYGDQNLAVQRAGQVRKVLRWRVAPLGEGGKDDPKQPSVGLGL